MHKSVKLEPFDKKKKQKKKSNNNNNSGNPALPLPLGGAFGTLRPLNQHGYHHGK